MLRTSYELANVYVPPPPPVEGTWKKVKRTITLDLNSGHRHILEEDWNPDGATDEEKAAASRMAELIPPRAASFNAGRPIDETPEEYQKRMNGKPGAMDVSSSIAEGRGDIASEGRNSSSSIAGSEIAVRLSQAAGIASEGRNSSSSIAGSEIASEGRNLTPTPPFLREDGPQTILPPGRRDPMGDRPIG